MVSHNQGRTLSARSAVEAIQAAMALSIKIPCPERKLSIQITKKDALTDVTEAVNEVKKSGLLMFYSASDGIQTAATKKLQYGQQREHIFSIGALRFGSASVIRRWRLRIV
ncbi:intracellular serine protease [Trichoderma arundinaceum]|uniref:Intracellular serine protease n=1 Tax=Trichoderma arundinaceum TaxID=490622 RepID=A0A395NNQ0_TRIAR|nr:intracellular serine protease [Trichoderma arundinaceum]